MKLLIVPDGPGERNLSARGGPAGSIFQPTSCGFGGGTSLAPTHRRRRRRRRIFGQPFYRHQGTPSASSSCKAAPECLTPPPSSVLSPSSSPPLSVHPLRAHDLRSRAPVAVMQPGECAWEEWERHVRPRSACVAAVRRRAATTSPRRSAPPTRVLFRCRATGISPIALACYMLSLRRVAGDSRAVSVFFFPATRRLSGGKADSCSDHL